MSAIKTSAEHSSASSLANRYGAPKRGLSHRTRRIALIVALVAAIAAAGIITATSATPPVTSKDVGFSITDPTQIRVDFQISKDPGATAQCAVQALSSNYAVVGWTIVTIGPTAADAGTNGGRTTAEQVLLRTESKAVTGGVENCWLTEEN